MGTQRLFLSTQLVTRSHFTLRYAQPRSNM